FIVLDFGEGKEYRINIDTDDGGSLDGPADKIDGIEIDTHDTVTLTSVELDGVDVSGQVGRRDDDSFVIALRNLAVGEYTLTCTAVDEVGNDIDADNCKFDFEVVERGDYEVPLNPGWNLVSLPGTPADPAIDSVLPSSMSASRVLQWVDGAFEVAERGDDGMWDPSGQITEITAGPGYWVFTTAFEDIETLIPERSPATVLPTVDIVGGWNLVGIVDLAQADAGDAPGGAGDVLPSAYFASLTWSVAYSYDTTSGLWTKYTGADEDDSVVNGKGYWIWATKAGTLVP
ncbi:MAG: hypothetical protein IIC32_06760, partial [Chloroflexi bacterium]|nr:hypothetical protein [Chloroflexota bacterium]